MAWPNLFAMCSPTTGPLQVSAGSMAPQVGTPRALCGCHGRLRPVFLRLGRLVAFRGAFSPLLPALQLLGEFFLKISRLAIMNRGLPPAAEHHKVSEGS